MKNLIYIGAGTILLTFSSCKKEQVQVNPNSLEQYSTVYEKDYIEDKRGWIDLKHFVSNFPEWGQYGCYKPAENCLPEYTVPSSKSKGSQKTIKEEFLSLKKFVRQDKSGTNINIRNFFKSKSWNQIFPYLRKEVAKDIADGKLKITSKTSSLNSNVEIFVVLNKNSDVSNFKDSDVIIAMPIKN